MDGAHPAASDESDARRWFLTGAARSLSTPAFVLMAAYFGFGGLARDTGFTLFQSAFMTAVIWAMPSQLVLVGALTAGASLPGMAFVVTLSAVRLLPMTLSLIPVLRSERTSRWTLFGLSHFIAVTTWVEGFRALPGLPRPARLRYFAGFGAGLVGLNMTATVAGYLAAASFPPALSQGLLLLTPIYFLLSLTAAATVRLDRIAMVAGLVVGPAAYYLGLPGNEMLWAGLLGGTVAFLVGRSRT